MRSKEFDSTIRKLGSDTRQGNELLENFLKEGPNSIWRRQSLVPLWGALCTTLLDRQSFVVWKMVLWVYCGVLGATRTSTNYYARHCIGTRWTTRPIWGWKGRGSFLDFQSDWIPTNKHFKPWSWYKWPRNWLVWCANTQSRICYVTIFYVSKMLSETAITPFCM